MSRVVEDLDNPTVYGVYDAPKDARRAAEVRDGTPLVWHDGRLSADYQVIEVERFTHPEVREVFKAMMRVDLVEEG